jgi:hypothetical protein
LPTEPPDFLPRQRIGPLTTATALTRIPFSTKSSRIQYIRVGEDYYLAGPTMHMNPAVQIMHSRDMVNWELVGYCSHYRSALSTRFDHMPLRPAISSESLFAAHQPIAKPLKEKPVSERTYFECRRSSLSASYEPAFI